MDKLAQSEGPGPSPTWVCEKCYLHLLGGCIRNLTSAWSLLLCYVNFMWLKPTMALTFNSANILFLNASRAHREIAGLGEKSLRSTEHSGLPKQCVLCRARVFLLQFQIIERLSGCHSTRENMPGRPPCVFLSQLAAAKAGRSQRTFQKILPGTQA